MKHISLQVSHLLTVLYAFNTKEEIRSMWQYLEDVIIGVSMPWLVMWDFNSVLKVEDKVGGNPISMRDNGFS